MSKFYHVLCVWEIIFLLSGLPSRSPPTSTPLPWAKETPLTDWRSPQLARLTSSIVECSKQIVDRRWTSIHQSIRAHLKKVMKLGKEWKFPWISNKKHMLHHKHRRAQFLQSFFDHPKCPKGAAISNLHKDFRTLTVHRTEPPKLVVLPNPQGATSILWLQRFTAIIPQPRQLTPSSTITSLHRHLHELIKAIAGNPVY